MKQRLQAEIKENGRNEIMQGRIKEIGFSSGMIAVSILLYQIVSDTIMGIGYSLFSTKEAFYQHTSMLDTFAVILLIVVFSIWLYKIVQKKQNTNELPVKSMDQRMFIPLSVVVFGLKGITGLWFYALEAGVNKIPLFAESMENYNDTWGIVEEEPYFWVFLSVAALGPVVEELLFRGIVFHYLEKIKAGWFAIVVSGVLFGLWHQEPVQCVYTALVGVAYGLIYAKVRDLRVMIGLHILNNFLATLPPALDTDSVNGMIGIVSMVMIIPSIVILVRMAKEQNQQMKQCIIPDSPL